MKICIFICVVLSIFKIQAKVIELNGIDKVESFNKINYFFNKLKKEPCIATIDKIFAMSDKQQIRQIIEIPDGYIVGGSTGQELLMLKIDKNYKYVWSTSIELTQSVDIILSMKLTSDNNLIAVGSYAAGTSNEDDFILKYDIINNKTIWVKSFEGGYQEIFFDIVENTINGNYLIFGQKYDSNNISNTLMVEFNNINGSIIFEKFIGTNAQLPSNTHYKSTQIINKSGNNRVYVASRFTYGSANEFMRPALSEFDLNGNLMWSKTYTKNINSYSRLYLNHVLERQGFLYAAGIGDLNGVSLENNTIQFLKTDLNGNLVFNKDISISNSKKQRIEKVFDADDGIVLIINYLENSTFQKSAIVKLDYNGKIIWSKTIEIPIEEVSFYDVILNSSKDSLLLAGEIKSNFDPGDLLLLQLNSSTGECGCIDVVDANLVISNLPLISYVSPIETHTDKLISGVLINNQSNAFFKEKYFCSENNLRLDSISLNCNDSDSLFIRICNEGKNEFKGNFPISIYNLDPEIYNSAPINTTLLQLTLMPGECYSLIYKLNSTDLNQVNFGVINDTGNFNLPYDLESGVGFNPIISECNYVDNKKNFNKINSTNYLDLGENKEICIGTEEIIGTNFIFKSYKWNTGDTTSTIKAKSEGLYILNVTDNCDNVYSDSILINFLNPPKLDFDNTIKICPDNQISLGLDSIVKNIKWYLNSQILCTSCDSINFSTKFNTTIYFDFTFNSCKFKDSINLILKSTQECIDCGILNFPNVFSPNNDGINDIFYPISNECIEFVEELEIYNRWGGLVFKNNHFKANVPIEGWNGIFNGQQSPIEVYVYKGSYITKGGKFQKFKGDITLIR